MEQVIELFLRHYQEFNVHFIHLLPLQKKLWNSFLVINVCADKSYEIITRTS
jgi:hypothetical protein